MHEKLARPGETFFYHSRVDDPRFMEVPKLVCPIDHRTLAITGLLEELEPILKEGTDTLGSQTHSHMIKDYYNWNSATPKQTKKKA